MRGPLEQQSYLLLRYSRMPPMMKRTSLLLMKLWPAFGAKNFTWVPKLSLPILTSGRVSTYQLALLRGVTIGFARVAWS